MKPPPRPHNWHVQKPQPCPAHVTLGPDSSHHVPGCKGAHLWMVDVRTVPLDRNLQNDGSRGLLPSSHTALLWPGQLSPTDIRTSAPGARPPPFCWRSSGCTREGVCVCICVGARCIAGQVNQLRREQIQRLFCFFLPLLALLGSRPEWCQLIFPGN